MLRIYKTNGTTKNTKKIKKMIADSWIDLVSPTVTEVEMVAEKTKIDKDLILKMMDEDELPRIEQSGNATLIVIDTPSLDEGVYTTNPLGIIITDNNYIITIAPKKIFVLSEFRKDKVKDFRTAKKTRFLIQILLKTASLYLKVLRLAPKSVPILPKILQPATIKSI